MSWLAPTAADVLTEFTAVEKTSIVTAQGGTDNTSVILTRVVAEVRDAIRSGSMDLAADTTTIPLGLHGTAIDLARWRLLIALPALKQLQTDARKEAMERAQKRLDAIAEGKYGVEPPTAGANDRGGNWGSENKLIGRMHPSPRPAAQFPVDPDDYANPLEPADSAAANP